MTSIWYILDKDHNVIPATLEEGINFFERREDRRVARDEKHGIIVSTVFLCVDHSWDDGPPYLFETMIFGGDNDGYQERCSTWNEAVAMHKRACVLAFGEN